jgi:general secretion pathway protein E
MNNTQSRINIIDYSLFDKYSYKYFLNNYVLPIYEDDKYLYLAICKDSMLDNINEKFARKLKFQEIDTNEIKFFLSNVLLKKDLYNLLSKQNEKINNENHTKLFFDKIVDFAIKNRASDIHIESNLQSLVFRFRIDGTLKTFFTLKSIYAKQISSYIKLISNLDITQNRLPQDSRFKLNIDDINYDFRVSILPILDGESIVIRVLDSKNSSKTLDTLGFSKHIKSELTNAINLKQGLILVAGPTGSGKTTTIYSLLKLLNSDNRKIITIEDPVEYKIDNIQQITVDNKIGLTFNSLLKNILRQDPDVLLIGEIRDEESLNIALQASLTGHLVISTVHSNSALQTISRLIDLKADEFLLSTSLKYILSQRLVLSYCKSCDNKGCEKCNYTGYFDRLSLGEIIKIDENISSMLLQNNSYNLIKEYLTESNYIDIFKDGMTKVNEKLTSKEEIYKVINYE